MGLSMKRRAYHDLQRHNPNRSPNWRWDRAHELLLTGQSFSKKRDDVGTGIALTYLQEIARCHSDLRLKRARARFVHLDRARQLWEDFRDRRIELEARILARQTDVAIGLEMNLHPAAVQAFRDVFFHIDDRIDQVGYILHRVIGLSVVAPAPPVEVMKASAYFHGSLTIPPWLELLKGNGVQDPENLETETARTRESIEIFLTTRALPDSPEIQRSWRKLAPYLFEISSKRVKPITARNAFSAAVSTILSEVYLPESAIAPYSYLPQNPKRLVMRFPEVVRGFRKAA